MSHGQHLAAGSPTPPRDEFALLEMQQANVETLAATLACARASDRAGQRLSRLRPEALRRLSVLDLRCPERGCLLARVYRLGQGLYVDPADRHDRGTFIGWPKAPPPPLSARCRHGNCRVDERLLIGVVESSSRPVAIAGSVAGVSWRQRREHSG